MLAGKRRAKAVGACHRPSCAPILARAITGPDRKGRAAKANQEEIMRAAFERRSYPPVPSRGAESAGAPDEPHGELQGADQPRARTTKTPPPKCKIRAGGIRADRPAMLGPSQARW